MSQVCGDAHRHLKTTEYTGHCEKGEIVGENTNEEAELFWKTKRRKFLEDGSEQPPINYIKISPN